MSEKFWRWHQADAPTFSSDNAWSGLWGTTFSPDGSQAECLACDGTGEAFDEPCQNCSGGGWIDLDRGYSCCWTAEDLTDYFRSHLASDPGDGEVIEFTGTRVGTGFDGEPLAVPTQVIRRMTWQELINAQGEGEGER